MQPMPSGPYALPKTDDMHMESFGLEEAQYGSRVGLFSAILPSPNLIQGSSWAQNHLLAIFWATWLKWQSRGPFPGAQPTTLSVFHPKRPLEFLSSAAPLTPSGAVLGLGPSGHGRVRGQKRPKNVTFFNILLWFQCGQTYRT